MSGELQCVGLNFQAQPMQAQLHALVPPVAAHASAASCPGSSSRSPCKSSFMLCPPNAQPTQGQLHALPPPSSAWPWIAVRGLRKLYATGLSPIYSPA
eukprot:98566-Chlamydomonas_euryale.AAC.12